MYTNSGDFPVSKSIKYKQLKSAHTVIKVKTKSFLVPLSQLECFQTSVYLELEVM